MIKEEKTYELIHSFRELKRALYQIMQNEASKMDTTGMQTYVLNIVRKKPNISLGELSQLAHASNSTMSGIVDRLVKSGWLVRERSEADRRSLTVRLTPEGEVKQKEAHEHLLKRLTQRLQLTDEEIDQLLHLHQHIISKLHQERDEE